MKKPREISFLSVFACLFVALVAFASPSKAANTQLQVTNTTNTAVEVWWNGTNPTASNITVKTPGGRAIPVEIPAIFTDAGKGMFTLNTGESALISRTAGGAILNGTITFNCIPVCPCGGTGQPPCPQVGQNFRLPTKLVNGVNQAEFALNTGFESVDISCVNGANCRVGMVMTGGSPKWSTNTIANKRVEVASRVDENCAQVGVFPFNATDCTNTPNPPCGSAFCFHTIHNCQLDRRGSGGLVSIEIQGFE